MSPLVSFDKVNKIYKTGYVEIPALIDVSFQIGRVKYVSSLDSLVQARLLCLISLEAWIPLHRAD